MEVRLSQLRPFRDVPLPVSAPVHRRVRFSIVLVALALTTAAGGILGLRFPATRALARGVRRALRASGDSLPDQRQGPERLRVIQALDPQRSGALVVTRSFLDQPPTGRTESVVRFDLAAPASRVEDADIRGFLDGDVKYDFNQGTAYHMRVGRRFGGRYRGRYELKRSLVGWQLPDLPSTLQISSATIRLWVEGFYFTSPLIDPNRFRPLHLFAYPVDEPWNAGQGGVGHDDFSPPRRGEASWNFARAGEVEWKAPGVLSPRDAAEGSYVEDPVAMAEIPGSDLPVVLESPSLIQLVQESLNHGSVDLLFKLDEEEERRPGTEMAFLTSNFGDVHDVHGKRPTLRVGFASPHPSDVRRHPFEMEAGTNLIFPVARHPERTVLLAVEAERSSSETVPVEIFVRGGTSGETEGDVEWSALTNPVVRRWDWSQVKLSTRYNELAWGDTFHVELQETWVKPGPRVREVPELLAIAPSGKIHRLDGQPAADSWFDISFVPDELGLWRYGWSFRPTRERRPGTHVGEGLFYVDVPSGRAGRRSLSNFADALIVDIEELGGRDDHVQTNVNGFARALQRFSHVGGVEEGVARDLMTHVTNALTEPSR